VRVAAIAIGAALASGVLWYLALAVALDVSEPLALALAVVAAALTIYAITRDATTR